MLVSTRDATIHVRTWSPDRPSGDGPPLLLIHGFPLTSALWDDVARGLVAAGHRVLAPDLRGFGESRGAPARTLADHVDDLVAVLEAVGVASLPWVGFSMGGYVAFEALRRAPERILALGLVDTKAEADTDEARQGRYALAARVAEAGSRVVADAMTPKLFAAGANEGLRRTWHARMAAADPAAVADALVAMATRPDSTPLLASIDRPTVVVVGDEDVLTPPSDAERLAASIRGARLVRVPGAGHATPVERPDDVARALGALGALAKPPRA